MITYNDSEITLKELIDLLHDLFISLESITYSKDDKTIRFPIIEFIKNRYTGKHPEYRFEFLIRGAAAYKINDTEKIGSYDINKLLLEGNKLTIETGVDLEFTITLEDNFDIILTDSPKLAEYKRQPDLEKIAELLEAVLEGKITAEQAQYSFPCSTRYPDPLVQEAYCYALEHYRCDEDLMSKDKKYRKIMDDQIRDLIARIKRRIAGGKIHLPIFIIDEAEDVDVYTSIEEAEESVEKPDIEAGLYSCYDSKGNILHLETKDYQGQIYGTGKNDAQALKQALMTEISRIPKAFYSTDFEQMSLEQMVQDFLMMSLRFERKSLSSKINRSFKRFLRRRRVNKPKKFQSPCFSNGCVELRIDENDTVCIYGSREGLKKIAGFCIELADNPNKGHIHLEDYQILTKNSKIGAIAIFKEQELKNKDS